MSTKGNTRKNRKADAAAIAEAQAIAQMADVEVAMTVEVTEKPTKTLKSLAELEVALPEIVIELDDADVADLMPEELVDVVVASEQAKAIRSEAFALKNEARVYQDEREKQETNLQAKNADLLMLKNELRASQEEWDRYHRALTAALFKANGIGKDVDALKGHPGHDVVKSRIMARATELLSTKDAYAKVRDNLELAKMAVQEREDEIKLIELHIAELRDKANELGKMGQAKFDEANALYKSAGFEVYERKEVKKSNK